MSFSNAGDVMLMSPSQSKDLHDDNCTLTTTNPPEGKTTAIIAVMKGKPKDGWHCHHSNKHYTQKLVRVLLDSGSDGTWSCEQWQTHAASLLKKASSTVVEYFEWDLPDKV